MKLPLTPIRRFRNALGVAVGLCALLGTSGGWRGAAVNAAGAAQSERRLGPEAACAPAGIARSVRDRKTGALRSIGTARGRPIPHPVRFQASRSPEAATRAYLTACAPLFGVRDATTELAITRTARAGARRSVVRLKQMHRGVPVVGGELIVHLDANNDIVALAGRTLPDVDIQTVASVPAATAAATAVRAMAKTHGVDPGALLSSSPELSIYSPALLGWGLEGAAAVWRMEVTPRDLLPIREFVLVDAARGAVVLHFNQVETVRDRRTYTALNEPTLPGWLVCDESDPSCTGGDSHAVGAHLSAADTYDFYLSMHGRDSIDNAGMPIVSTVHYRKSADAPFANAFWNGEQMVFGDGAGFALADDVVAHELTHGVTTSTSNLYYYYQSGAINESLSDMWGEFVDLTNGRGDDSAGVRWQMGEDITGLGALRSMSDPPLFRSPDRMTSALYDFDPWDADNGGVHTNSGINNKAAYLMVDGGSFNGQTITGLGITKVAQIYYEAQTHLLTSGSDYADLHDALYQGCQNLVGTAGVTAADCQQVRQATIAVEMHLQPVGVNPDAMLCPAGGSLTTLFFDDLESGPSQWEETTVVGPSRWYASSGFAHSGAAMLYGDDLPDVVSDASVGMIAGVTLPAGAFLHFAHAYAFELQSNFDGGVVEYSTNGGSRWTDAGALFDANGYTGTIRHEVDNPLGGRAGFVGNSRGYRSGRLNLGALAGETVRFRWRMGLDRSGYLLGWTLDDMRLYTCFDATIAASPATMLEGPANTITANITVNPAVPEGWAGLFPAAASDTGYVARTYLDDTQTSPATDTTTATLHIIAPLTPGSYNLRLFTGGVRIATSKPITVRVMPKLSISDASIPEGHSGTTTASFTVTLSPSLDPVTVRYATANNSAAAGSDYTAASGTLTFPPGTVTRSIVVPVTGDNVFEANETFVVHLSGAIGASIGRGSGVGTIVNDDGLAYDPTIRNTGGTYKTSSAPGTAVYQYNNPAGTPVWIQLVPMRAKKGGPPIFAYGQQIVSTSGWKFSKSGKPDPLGTRGVSVNWDDDFADADSFRAYFANAPDFNPYGSRGSATKVRFIDHNRTTRDGINGHDFSILFDSWADGTVVP
jgi:Zn-dependent metalloprotease